VTTTKMIVIGTLQDVIETTEATETRTTASESAASVIVDITKTKTRNAETASAATATTRPKLSARRGARGDGREMRGILESMMIVGAREITVIGNATGRGRVTDRTARRLGAR